MDDYTIMWRGGFMLEGGQSYTSPSFGTEAELVEHLTGLPSSLTNRVYNGTVYRVAHHKDYRETLH